MMHLRIGPLANQVNIVVADRGQETEGIVKLPDLPVIALDTQTVIEDLIAILNDPLEKTVLADPLQGVAGSFGISDIHDFTTERIVQVSSNQKASGPVRLLVGMHAEYGMRLVTFRLGDRVEF